MDLNLLWAMGKYKSVEISDYETIKYLSESAIERKRDKKSKYAQMLKNTRDLLKNESNDAVRAGLEAEIAFIKRKMKKLDKGISYHQNVIENLKKPTQKDLIDKRIDELENMLSILKKERENIKD